MNRFVLSLSMSMSRYPRGRARGLGGWGWKAPGGEYQNPHFARSEVDSVRFGSIRWFGFDGFDVCSRPGGFISEGKD